MATPLETSRDSAISNTVYIDKHARRLLCELNKTRKNDSLCDGTVVIGCQTIKIQKAVLFSASPYFRLIFSYEGPEGHPLSEADLTSLDIRMDTFETILDYIYTSHIQLSADNIQDILQAADVLLISELKKLCSDFLEGCINVENCLGILEFAERFTCPWLLHKVSKYIDEHFGEVSFTEEFQKLSSAALIKLLSRDTLEVRVEDSILDAVVRWYHSEKDRSESDLLTVVDACVQSRLVSGEYCSGLVNRFEPGPLHNLAKFLREKAREGSGGRRRGVTEVIMVTGGLAAGDNLGTPSSLVQCVDPKSQPVWMKVPSLTTSRVDHSMVECGGCIYVIGGGTSLDGASTNSGDKFDPVSGKWTPITPMNTPRSEFGLVSIDDNIYAISGISDTSSRQATPSVESYNIFTNIWTELPAMSLARTETACVAAGKQIYVIGGASDNKHHETVECFDTVTETWTTVSPLHERRYSCLAVNMDDYIFAFGGFRNYQCPSANMGHGGDNMKFCSTEVYSVERNRWTQIATKTGVLGLCARPDWSTLYAVLGNGRDIYAVGCLDMGEYGGNCVRAFEAQSNTWMSVVIDAPVGHTDFSCCMVKLPTQRLIEMGCLED